MDGIHQVPARIAFRTDASRRIGIGHVMRCLALAKALRTQGATCRFIMRDLGDNGHQKVIEEGFGLDLLPRHAEVSEPVGPPAHAAWAEVEWSLDARESRAVLEQAQPQWLVVDHYAFDHRWEQAAKPAVTKLLVIDDLADRTHVADLLLDQGLGRRITDYEGLLPPNAELLLGPGFALLRPEFAASRAETLYKRAVRSGKAALKLLLTMGGVDLPNATSHVLTALANHVDPATFAGLTVVMGSAAPALAQVKSIAAEMPWPTNVLTDVADMGRLMSEADLAIGAAGTTTWERCCLGLPSLMVPIADNQVVVAEAAHAAGAAINLGPCTDPEFANRLVGAVEQCCNVDGLRLLAEKAAAICDGDGTLRVIARMAPGASHLSFRKAEIADSRRVWEWRKAGGAERYYASSSQPAFREHHEWFRRALSDDRRIFRILEKNGLPCGYVRFDRLAEDTAEISCCLALDVRGTGLSIPMLKAADSLAEESGIRQIEARIHQENSASIRAFAAVGYQQVASEGAFLSFNKLVRGQQ